MGWSEGLADHDGEHGHKVKLSVLAISVYWSSASAQSVLRESLLGHSPHPDFFLDAWVGLARIRLTVIV